MSSQRVEVISGAIGSIMMTVFVIGLAHSISSGAAGFWGGLPFWVIVGFTLIFIWYDFWGSCIRKE